MKALKHKTPTQSRSRLKVGQKSPRKLAKTAALLVHAKSQKEVARIENALVNGFFGHVRTDKKRGRRISRTLDKFAATICQIVRAAKDQGATAKVVTNSFLHALEIVYGANLRSRPAAKLSVHADQADYIEELKNAAGGAWRSAEYSNVRPA